MKHASELKGEPNIGSGLLREMSVEVARLSKKLAELTEEDTELQRHEGTPGASQPGRTVARSEVWTVIRARRARFRFFSAELFADPAWDILLHLYQAEIAQHRVSVSAACNAAAAPPTTALRWIKTLVDQGLIARRPDPIDKRRVFLELTIANSAAMHGYFKETAGERRIGQE